MLYFDSVWYSDEAVPLFLCNGFHTIVLLCHLCIEHLNLIELLQIFLSDTSSSNLHICC